MKPLAPLVLALALATGPALAEDQTPAPNPDLSEGAQMLSEGMKRLLQGLLTEGAEGWDKLVDWLGDLSAYDPPERLPNGDIIIRRRVPLPEELPAPDVPDEAPDATEL